MRGKLLAFVSDDGILAMGDSPDEMRPLVFNHEKTVDALIPVVQRFFSGHGKKVWLQEFESVSERVILDGTEKRVISDVRYMSWPGPGEVQ